MYHYVSWPQMIVGPHWQAVQPWLVWLAQPGLSILWPPCTRAVEDPKVKKKAVSPSQLVRYTSLGKISQVFFWTYEICLKVGYRKNIHENCSFWPVCSPRKSQVLHPIFRDTLKPCTFSFCASGTTWSQGSMGWNWRIWLSPNAINDSHFGFVPPIKRMSLLGDRIFTLDLPNPWVAQNGLGEVILNAARNQHGQRTATVRLHSRQKVPQVPSATAQCVVCLYLCSVADSSIMVQECETLQTIAIAE